MRIVEGVRIDKVFMPAIIQLTESMISSPIGIFWALAIHDPSSILNSEGVDQFFTGIFSLDLSYRIKALVIDMSSKG